MDNLVVWFEAAWDALKLLLFGFPARVEPRPNGVMLVLPPAGLLKVKWPFLATLVMCLIGVISARYVGNALGAAAGFGLLMFLWGPLCIGLGMFTYSRVRRSALILIANGRVSIARKFMLGTERREWPAEDISGFEVGFELGIGYEKLLVHFYTGETIGLFPERDQAELHWMARELQNALRKFLPAARQPVENSRIDEPKLRPDDNPPVPSSHPAPPKQRKAMTGSDRRTMIMAGVALLLNLIWVIAWWIQDPPPEPRPATPANPITAAMSGFPLTTKFERESTISSPISFLYDQNGRQLYKYAKNPKLKSDMGAPTVWLVIDKDGRMYGEIRRRSAQDIFEIHTFNKGVPGVISPGNYSDGLEQFLIEGMDGKELGVFQEIHKGAGDFELKIKEAGQEKVVARILTLDSQHSQITIVDPSAKIDADCIASFPLIYRAMPPSRGPVDAVREFFKRDK